MTEFAQFNGFPKESVKFLKQLKKNNDKFWFDKHKSDYEDYILTPSRDYVVSIGARLRTIAPGIHADPRINKSLFKIYRDIRFSNDKRPFKTNLGIWLWDGKTKRFGCPGFYFHIEPPVFMLGVGIYMFNKELLEEYRNSVVHRTYGSALIKAISKTTKAGSYEINGKHYKKVPRGFDPQHKRAEYLLFNGLHASYETKIPAEFYTADIIDYSFERFKDMLPIHKWLLAMTARVGK